MLTAHEKQKLKTLAHDYGFDSVQSMLEENILDSCCPAICTNDGCDYSTEYEPDCTDGWCEACETQTVKSALVLAGIM